MSENNRNNPFHTDITRRDMLKVMGATAAAGLAGLSIPGGAEGAPAGQPNIVFILSDNIRYDCLGVTGHPFIQTPALDRLAGEGLLFENAFNTTSLCSPSRASFLTGAYARSHGVLNNHTPWTETMPFFLENLSETGYDTAFIGKFHLPGEGLPELPYLNEYVSFTIKEHQGQYFDCPLVVNGKEEPSNTPYLITELTDRALKYLDRERNDPFCLYLSYKTAHFPFLPPKDLAGMYADETPPIPGEVDPWLGRADGNVFEGTMVGSIENLYLRYCEAITGMDREIDRVLSYLDEANLADNTIVIYASDNGYMWGEHRLIGINWHYEEAIRLQFIVRCPWLVPDKGATRSQMVLNVDLAPTLMELAGVDIPDHVQGTSFLPILSNADAPSRDAWFYEYYKYFPEDVPNIIGVRTKTHKYVEFEGRMKPELYDLTADPKENINLYGTPEGESLTTKLKELMHTLEAELET